ncbi:MAG: hypothetical protein AB7L91_00820 [Dehalococcoidia bacterium]
MVAITVLEAAQRRTLIAGVRPDMKADFAQVMADMRDQGLNPFKGSAALLVGPYPSRRSRPGGRPLERAVLVVSGSQPHIEFELELLVGLIPDHIWHEEHVAHWIPTRYAGLPSGYGVDLRYIS